LSDESKTAQHSQQPGKRIAEKEELLEIKDNRPATVAGTS